MSPTDPLISAIVDGVSERLLAMQNTVPKRLLSQADAGRYLGRTEGAVKQMVKLGKIPVVHLDARVFIDVNDLDHLIEDSKVRRNIS